MELVTSISIERQSMDNIFFERKENHETICCDIVGDGGLAQHGWVRRDTAGYGGFGGADRGDASQHGQTGGDDRTTGAGGHGVFL